MYTPLTPSARAMRDRLLFAYRGGQTKRFHTADTLCRQTVAEHSFGVAWLVVLLYPQARKELILAALAHDLAEHQVGDVSSPAKRQYPALRDAVNIAEHDLLKTMGFDFETGLQDFELRILKLADMLDGMMFCVRERKMGSKMVVKIYDNFYRYVSEVSFHGFPMDAEDNARDYIKIINNSWEKYNESK